MEYLLRTRRQESEAAAKREEKGIVDDPETVAKRMMPLGLVGEMAEMDSVRWVVMRMKFSMEERVCFSEVTELMIATCLDGTSS